MGRSFSLIRNTSLRFLFIISIKVFFSIASFSQEIVIPQAIKLEAEKDAY